MTTSTLVPQLPVWLVALPLLAAFLLSTIYRTGDWPGRATGPLVLLACLAASVGLWLQVDGEGPSVLAMGGFQPPLGIVFYVDHMALLFTGASALLVLLLWPRDGEQRVRQETLSLLLAAGCIGLALSGDLFNLYVFYEITAVACYGLAASSGTAQAYGAALRYLILSALGSALALLGIAIIYAATGTLNLAHLAILAPQTLHEPLGLAAFTLLLLGLGVKAELFPVNTWVPEVYGSASIRVSGLLAGLVSKLALLVILRVMLLLYAGAGAHQVLLAVGMLGLVTGELAAWRATDLRRMLAYSSIGQLGLVAIAFSIPGPAGLLAGLAAALHHLVLKPALFLLADTWSGPLQGLSGVSRHAPWSAFLFLFLALSLVGVPPLPGFWAKFLTLKGALALDQGLYQLAAGLVLLAAVVEAGYLFRVVRFLYQGESTAIPVVPPPRDVLPATVLTALLALAMVSVAPLGGVLDRVAQGAADVDAYVTRVLPASPLAALEDRP